MNSSTLIRWSGMAAVLGAISLIVSDLLTLTVLSGDLAEIAASGAYLAEGSTRLFAGVLLLVGLVGMYARQSEAAGVLGLAAFLLAFFGTVMILGTWWTNTFVAPSLATEAPALLEAGPTGVMALAYTLSFALGGAGWLLFGLASLRARVFPRAASVALMVAAAITFVPLPVVATLFYLAVAWMGASLFVKREAPAGMSVNPANRPVH